MTSLKGGDVMVIDNLPFGVLSKLEMQYIERTKKDSIDKLLLAGSAGIFTIQIVNFVLVRKWNGKFVRGF